MDIDMYNDLFKETASQTKSHNVIVVLVLLFVMLFIAGLGLYLYYFKLEQNNTRGDYVNLFDYGSYIAGKEPTTELQDSSINQDSKINVDDYALLYAAAPKGYNVVPTLFLQFLDHSDNEIKIGKPDASSVWRADFKNGSMLAFITHSKDLKQYANENQVSKLIQDDDFLVDLSVINGKEHSFDFSKFIYVNRLSYNPTSNQVLISASNEKSVKKRSRPNAWSVYLLDLNTKQMQKLISGSGAQWVSRDSFVFLNNSGLAFMNIPNNFKRQVINFEAYTLDNIAYHNKARLLAISDLSARTITLFKVKNVNIFTVSKQFDIKSKAVDMIFSEDGKLLALLKIDKDAAFIHYYLTNSGAQLNSKFDNLNLANFFELDSIDITSLFYNKSISL